MPIRKRPFALVRTFAFGIAASTVLAGGALAQWIAVGRWGSEDNFRSVVPGTWMVLQRDDWVEISAEADNHDGRLTFQCSADNPGGSLRFERYFGSTLPRPIAPDDPHVSVALVIDGERFEQIVSYSPGERSWAATGTLASPLMDAFSFGSRMELVTGSEETVARFRLNGSGTARAAIRRICRI
ncbi:MAG: hypothetical protein Kow0013_27570 [Pararhodobacter sp.]